MEPPYERIGSDLTSASNSCYMQLSEDWSSEWPEPKVALILAWILAADLLA